MYQGERGGCARGGCEDDYPEAAATASFVAFFISDDRPKADHRMLYRVLRGTDA